MRVRVKKAGLLTTVQDRGRWGYQAMGVPVAGPMDLCSHRLANALAGNSDEAATLEVTLLGPELEFDDARDVVVVGAEFERITHGVVLHVRAGDTLSFGPRVRGARAYIAISGGIDTPPVLGSRATHLPSAMGGLEGRALKAGDELPLGPRTAPPKRGDDPSVRRADGAHEVRGGSTLRVLPAPQIDRFVESALEALQSASYRVGTDSNRMGYRLAGPRLEHSRGADIISDATPAGTLQVPASGQPILLMADRQTTGGYAKIATVISADLCVAGQLAPGDAVRFVVTTPAEAHAALIAQERALTAAASR